jgi:SfnB family sulfur acquisition oxidoreductase
MNLPLDSTRAPDADAANISAHSLHSAVDGPVTARMLTSDGETIAEAHAYAARIRPGAAERDAARSRPIAEIRDLRATGLLGLTVPRVYGGPDVSVRTLVEVFRIISAADPAIGQIPQSHFSHLDSLRALGTKFQKDFFFRDVLQGNMWGNALSERGTKGGLANIQSQLTRVSAGKHTLNGRKYYTTGAMFASWIPVTTLDEVGKIVMALINGQSAGVEIVDDWNSMGQRGTASGTVIFTDVEVPDEHIVPIWRFNEAPTTRFAFGQIMHIAIDVGIAEEALSDGVTFVRTRSRPWHAANLAAAGDDPHVIRRVGELKVQIEAAKALLYRAADALDAVMPNPLEESAIVDAAILVAAAKAAASAAAVRVSSDLFALAGTSAADETWNLHRHWRNARTHTLHDPEAWKYHYIGDFVLNNRRPPRRALII